MQVEHVQCAQALIVQGTLLITPLAFGDDCGWFFESWNENNFNEAAGETVVFSQDNHSFSVCGVPWGLLYQLAPATQAKLVRASFGSIFDVAVDIRRSSQSFCQWLEAILSGENKQQLWVQEGSSHGLFTFSAVAEVQYKACGFWNKRCKWAIRWDDPELAIHLPLNQLEGAAVSLSKKDAAGPSFKAAATP